MLCIQILTSCVLLKKVSYQFLKSLWTIHVMCLKKSFDQKNLLKISESENI